MSKNATHIKQTLKPSALDAFSLAFEYDVTWPQAKRSLKNRTI